MPARETHFIGIDAGTTGVRCLVMSVSGHPAGAAARRWATALVPGAPFGRSFDAEDYWRLTLEAVQEAVAASGVRPSEVAGLALTSQRLGLVAVGRRGRALFASPNADARAVGEGFAIDARLGQDLYATTGHYPALVLAPAKLQWLRAHDPDAFVRVENVLPLAAYLSYRMTGEAVAERGHLADCGLLDVRDGTVARPLLETLDLDPDRTPPARDPGQPVGGLRAGAARGLRLRSGTPVFAAPPDTQAALLGCGVLNPGEGGVVAGWSAPAQIVTAAPMFDDERRTWTTLYLAPGRWAVESNAADAGRVWSWAVRTLVGDGERAMRRAFAAAATVPPGADGVTALLGPAVMGPRAMRLRPGGLFLRVPMALGEASRAALLRAVLESVVFAVKGNWEQAEAVAGGRCEAVVLTGGLARAPLFAQTLADVLDRPLEVALAGDSATRGAALCAAVGAGAFPSFQAARPMTSPARTVEPHPAASATYADHYRRWVELDLLMSDLADRTR